jgi:ketosteroid isomerase-like protein
MPDDEQEIRTLIEQWAGAVHRGDMDRVVADHADDIVMFDVPTASQLCSKTINRRSWSI